jgi:DNA sulfur modification protein DndC
VRGIELITMEELHEIRRIWLVEKREIEDTLPGIYRAATGQEFPGASSHMNVSAEIFSSLAEICGDDALHYEMMRDLIATERRFATMAKRVGLFEEIDRAIKRSFYRDRDDAIGFARERRGLYGEEIAADGDDVVDGVPVVVTPTERG